MKRFIDAWRRWRAARQAEPEAELSRASRAPDTAIYLDAWREGTDLARRRTAEVRVDISYGNHESERFDLYLPVHRAKNLPFAAFVHCSEWRQVMRSAAGFPAKAIHRQGAAFVAIGFDAVPEVDLSAQVDQVRRAWRYLMANAGYFGLDASRGHLLGHGAGAHLAALAAFDPRGPPPASAVLLSGLYDLEPVRLAAAYGYLGLDPETAALLSPIRCIPGAGPAVIVAWGEREPEEVRRQSEDFARACKARGLRVVQGELPGRNHFETSLELTNPHSEVFATLRGRY